LEEIKSGVKKWLVRTEDRQQTKKTRNNTDTLLPTQNKQKTPQKKKTPKKNTSETKPKKTNQQPIPSRPNNPHPKTKEKKKKKPAPHRLLPRPDFCVLTSRLSDVLDGFKKRFMTKDVVC